MSESEPTAVSTLELYRQGARLEGLANKLDDKIDKLDDKLDGHSERIVQLEHRVNDQDRRHGELKVQVEKSTDNRWRVLSAWISGLALLVATLVGIYAMTKGVR